MAKDCSFDVVSEVDMQEVTNAVNQAQKEIGTRYDFRGSKCEITLDGDSLKIIADDDYKLSAVIDVLKGKMVKRNVSLKKPRVWKSGISIRWYSTTNYYYQKRYF